MTLFGECAILDDGRLVVAPWNTPGLYIGTVLIQAPQVRFPDAVLTAGGSVWVSAKNQSGLNVSVILWKAGISKIYTLPVGCFGSRTIIRADGESCRVACTTSPSTWRSFQVDPNGTMTASEQGVIADGSGARGMRDWLNGSPRPLTPLNQLLNGHPVRSIVGAGNVSIACGLPPLPPQTVCQIGGTLGTLVQAEIDQLSPRVSANGKFWCGVWYPDAAIRSGPLPATAPPLIEGGPPVPPTATATIESYQTPILLGQTSRAVRKVTSGSPTHIRWQYQDGSWVTAATNPVSDPDHHYAFPRVGQFPIRIQTLINGVVTDTSSGTSRVVTVMPVTPIPPEPPDPTPQPPTPGPGQVVVHVTDTKVGRPITGADTWSQLTPGTIVKTDANGYALITASASGVCTKKDGYHSPGEPEHLETCKVLAPIIELVLQPIPPPAPPVPIIHAAGKIFRTATNEPWRYKGVSAFKLCRLFDDGKDILPFLEAYAGFNVLRVWAYTDWAGTGWEASTAEATRQFFDYCMSKGFLVEYTLLTNDSLERSDWAREFVAKLAESPKPPIFIEGRNEPQTHSQSVSTARLKPALEASGFVYASGNYEISANAFGPYLVAHTQRDSEWPRRCHDLMEYFNGGGPHKPTDPSHKVPCLADEPPKTQDVAPPKPPLTKADDWRAYFGGCALLGGGATFHSETGKWGDVPTVEEQTLAAAALEGLNAFPADAPLGPYSRPNDSSLRTYIVGNYMVRIRPTTATPSFSGWTRIGTSNVLWKR